jgi:parallel beta-helix repeat protein
MTPKYKIQVIIIAVLFLTVNLFATNYFVRKSGNDGNDGLSPSTAWKTVTKAAQYALSPGDTVFIGAGDYWEQMKVASSGSAGNPIVFYGDKTGEHTGDAGDINVGDGNKNNIFHIENKNYIVGQGIVFRYGRYSGVYIKNSANIILNNCEMYWNKMYGIYCKQSQGELTIDSTTVKGGSVAGIGIYKSYNHINFVLKNSAISDASTGVYVYKTEVDSIWNNVIKKNTNLGIYLHTVNRCDIIAYNQVHENWNNSNIYIYKSSCGNISHNTVYKSKYYGIYVYGSKTSYSLGTVEHNEVHDIWDKHGIYIKYINADKISNNLIYNFDDRGIYFSGNSQYTVNHIDSNTVHDGWGDGIYIYKAREMKSITGNVVYNTKIGIYWNTSTHNTVADFSSNILHHNITGGIKIKKMENSTIRNNLIYGNQYYWSSWGIYIHDNGNRALNVINNTIYQVGKYGIYGKNIAGVWKNNIVMGNIKGIYGAGNFDVVTSYNCVYDNIYNWYDEASQGIGSFSEAPLFVNPAGVDGTLGGSGWLDDDLHIKSTGFSWHFGSWAPDDADSPCLDTGDPNDDYSNEPEDNGDRINIGCYGNTYQASRGGGGGPVTAIYPYFPLATWVLIGVPLVPEDGDPFAVYGDDFGGEMPNGENWMCIRWTTEDSVSEYYEYGDGTIYQPPDCYPGISHFVWVASEDEYVLNVDVNGYPLNNQVTLDVAAAPSVDWGVPSHPPGFNMFANPFMFTIDWSNSKILYYKSNENYKELTLDQAAKKGLISRYAYIWDHTTNQYEIIIPDETKNDDTLSVWQGFWFVQLDSVSDLELVIPNTKVLAKPSLISKDLAKIRKKHNYKTATVSTEWDWFLKIGAVSDDGILQDTQNGIGVSDSAKDGFDAWDALDFKGSDIWGNFVQMQFRNSEDKFLAYDIHAQFDDSDNWEFRVRTDESHFGKTFYLVWPQIRLVPESVKFTLYDSQNSTVLVPDLRNSANQYYSFEIPENGVYFNIKATYTEDHKAPDFSFVISQNSYFPDDASFYIIPNEPLLSIEATFNNEPVELMEINSPPNIYYYRVLLDEPGIKTLAVSATDFSGNIGTGSAALQVQLLKTAENNRILTKNTEIELNISAGALEKDIKMLLYSGKMDLEFPKNSEMIGMPIYIGPENITFKKPAYLKLKNIDKSLYSESALYFYQNEKWTPVCQYSENMPITRTGIYQLFKTTTDYETQPIIVNKFYLYPSHPNPFNNSTTIKYSLEKTGLVSLKIYDLLGKEVRSLFNNIQQPGYYNYIWNGKNNSGQIIASGTYLLKLIVSSGGKTLFENNQKLTLLK